MRRDVSSFGRSLLLVLLLVPFCSQICQATTLYERSLGQFKAEAQRASPDDYTFVVLGDSRDGDPTFIKAPRLARSFRPLFILHGGDYSESGGEAETAHFLSMVNETAPDVPIFVVMGNHENRGVFAREIGPGRFTVESKKLGFTLVAVDDSAEALTPAELKYLRSRLSSGGKARFAAMHVPPKTERWSWHVFTDGEAELKAILHKNKPQAVFFSHLHLFDRSEFAGVPAIITGGAGAPLVATGLPGDPVHHIVVVRVRNGKASIRKVVIPE